MSGPQITATTRASEQGPAKKRQRSINRMLPAAAVACDLVAFDERLPQVRVAQAELRRQILVQAVIQQDQTGTSVARAATLNQHISSVRVAVDKAEKKQT